MSVLFCTICNNLLSSVFNNNTLALNCDKCTIVYPSKNEDSLRKERIKEDDIMVYEKILNKAVDDPVTIKVNMKCLDKKCKGTIVKQVRVGTDMRLYNICTICKSQFLNN